MISTQHKNGATAMNSYEARKAAKAERYRQFAENAKKRADASFGRVSSIADQIPFGQPILVGHHSERRARKDAERIHNGMVKGIEEQKKADYWAGRAHSVESDTSISSQDPDACEKLRAKIAELEAKQTQMKAINKALRSKDPVTACAPLGLSAETVQRLLTAERYSWEKPGYQTYELSNLNANIRRYKQRLDELSKTVEQDQPERPRWMYAKRAGTCAACNQPIMQGDFIAWYRVAYEAKHHACA